MKAGSELSELAFFMLISYQMVSGLSRERFFSARKKNGGSAVGWGITLSGV